MRSELRFKRDLRAMKMWLFMEGYSLFAKMQEFRILSQAHPTMEMAEIISSEFNRIFGFDTTPEDIMNRGEVDVNNAIDCYEEMCEYIGNMEYLGMEKESILASYKWIYYQCEFTLIAGAGKEFYPDYAMAVVAYTKGFMDFKEMRSWFFESFPWCKEPRYIDTKGFRRDWVRLERIYSMIEEKRKKREK